MLCRASLCLLLASLRVRVLRRILASSSLASSRLRSILGNRPASTMGNTAGHQTFCIWASHMWSRLYLCCLLVTKTSDVFPILHPGTPSHFDAQPVDQGQSGFLQGLLAIPTHLLGTWIGMRGHNGPACTSGQPKTRAAQVQSGLSYSIWPGI